MIVDDTWMLARRHFADLPSNDDGMWRTATAAFLADLADDGWFIADPRRARAASRVAVELDRLLGTDDP